MLQTFDPPLTASVTSDGMDREASQTDRNLLCRRPFQSSAFDCRGTACTTTASYLNPKRVPGHRGAGLCGQQQLQQQCAHASGDLRTTDGGTGTWREPSATDFRIHAEPMICVRPWP